MLPKCEAYLRINDFDSLQKEIERGDASPGGAPMYFMELGRCEATVAGLAAMLTILNGRKKRTTTNNKQITNK